MEPPLWLATFADQVSLAIEGFDLLAPIGAHYHYNDVMDQWELTLFPSSTEVFGGQLDGKRTFSRFSLNIGAVLEAFSTSSQVRWQSHPLGEDDQLGQHVSVEGSVDDNLVWLRILAMPPAGIDPGRRFVEAEQRLEELW